MSDHMRLIDANKLKLALLEEDGEIRQYCFPCKKILKAIDEAETVERKRGKWRENGEPNAHGKYELWYYDCNLCGAVGIQEFNYCPNCGAEMTT